MAATGTAALIAQIKPVYIKNFYMQGQSMLYIDQLCDLWDPLGGGGMRGNQAERTVLWSMQPNQVRLDELSDVAANRLSSAAINVPIYEYGNAIDLSRFLIETSYVDVTEQAAYANGYNMAESLDCVARAVMGQGSRAQFPTGKVRSTLAGTTVAADRISTTLLEQAKMRSNVSRTPQFDDQTLCAVMHPIVHHDLLQSTSVRDLAIRQAPEMLLNGEMAYWSGMRVIVTANQKTFFGAGAALASPVSTTLAASADVGATNLKVTATTNIDANQWVFIRDAAETGNTWTDTNEAFFVTTVGTSGAGGTGIDGYALDPGPSDNGGLRYAHASGTAVVDNNSVFPVFVVGPRSVTKVASEWTGAWGKSVVTGPFDRLERMITLGWYLIGGHGRTLNQWNYRLEVGSSEM